jgi:hypothetical protein
MSPARKPARVFGSHACAARFQTSSASQALSDDPDGAPPANGAAENDLEAVVAM